MKDKTVLSIVLPTYNEEENIRPFYSELKDIIDGLDSFIWEIIFVDDGSSDRTVPDILDIRKLDPRVKLLQLSRNFGSHPAIMAGFHYVSGQAAIVMSVDLQDPPSLITQFIKNWDSGSHVVWGRRISRSDPFLKALPAKIFNWIRGTLILPGFPKEGMDCGLFDCRVIQQLLRSAEVNVHVFSAIFWLGYKQTFVPYNRRSRTRGKSKWSFARKLQATIDIFVSFSYLPIRVMSYSGMLISLTGFLYATVLAARRLIWGLGTDDWASLMVVTLCLGGLQLLMLGVLGEYIWRTNEQVKSRPVFVVMKENGLPISPEARTS